MTPRPHALIALGSNQESRAGGPADTLREALRLLCTHKVKLIAVSQFFRTPAFPTDSGPDFVNAAATLGFEGTPDALLTILHGVEAELGRERQTRWSERTLDLDLIAFGDQVLPDEAGYEYWRALPPGDQARLAPDRLILPHPRLQDRGFVLIPLADIAPGWRHPVLNRSVSEMAAARPAAELAEIRPI